MNEHACPYCEGPGQELGTLGTLTHLRCRDCGNQWSEKADAEDER